jgi:predicted N-acetyltransferase YhbS
MAIEIRGARADEMDEVLEMVPRVMGATREYFAAAYRNDPWGRPEHSRIVKRDEQIVSHIRLYDRWQRVGPVPVRVGCAGDVCTLPEHRKQGHCRALLEDALRYWDENAYDLSMIVSGVGVYAACGWCPLRETQFEMPAQDLHEAASRRAYEVRRFVRGEDLTAVAAVYADYNRERSLTTVRSSSYWERHFAWIAGEIEEAFLVAARGGRIVAYLRCEGGGRHVTVSECCCLTDHEPAAVELLDAALTFAAKRRFEGIRGHLPADHPALAAARQRPGFSESTTAVLLFRLVNLTRLLERLQPLLSERARVAGIEGELTLRVGDQQAGLRVRPGWVNVDEPGATAVDLPPAAFFGLLFGAVQPELALAGMPADAARVLAGLFPAGAPVYWRTDVV